MIAVAVGFAIMFCIVAFYAMERILRKNRPFTGVIAVLEVEKMKRLANREVNRMSTMSSWKDTLVHNGYTEIAKGAFQSPDGGIISYDQIKDIFNSAYSNNISQAAISQAAVPHSQYSTYSTAGVTSNVIYGSAGGGIGVYQAQIYPNQTLTIPSAMPNLPMPTGHMTSAMYFDPMLKTWTSINVDLAYVTIINQLNAYHGQTPFILPALPDAKGAETMQDGEFSLDEIRSAEVIIKDLDNHAN